MCEKVGTNYKIGDIEEGFDYKRIIEFYKQYDDFFDDCHTCWALRLCKKCFHNIRNGADFDRLRKSTMCMRKLKLIEDGLVAYCEIIEKKPDAFKVFKEINVT